MTGAGPFFTSVKVPNDKERLRNRFELKDYKEMRQLNEMYSCELNPFVVKDITGTTDET